MPWSLEQRGKRLKARQEPSERRSASQRSIECLKNIDQERQRGHGDQRELHIYI